MNSKLSDSVLSYLGATLGLPSAIEAWPEAGALPWFLQDAFRWFRLQLAGFPCLVAVEQRAEPPTAAELQRQLAMAGEAAGLPVLYAVAALTSWQRRHLIARRVAFVVPGTQLYLPPLGVDLREHFPVVRSGVSALSPVAQALLVRALLQPQWHAESRLAQLNLGLGYSPMSLSRATHELAGVGLATVVSKGREKWLQFAGGPADIWLQAQPLLRSPVRKTVWARADAIRPVHSAPLAGLSALAGLSLLAAPPVPVYALAPEDAAAAQAAAVPAGSDPHARPWQLWRYSPQLAGPAEYVDPLSLILSLRDDPDDRVRLSLEQLRETLPW